MSWQDYKLARRFLDETRIDTRIRQQAAEERAREDAQFKASTRALQRVGAANGSV